ncbi:hypothetical protein PRIC2_001294 [Phytophthora ramorum]
MGLLRSYMDAMLTATLSPFSSPRGSSSDSATTPKKGNKKLPSAPSVPVSATVTRSPPQRLSDFKVLETLAPALFGEVLLCLDTKTGRQFAVKRVDLRCARAQVTVGKQIRVVESLQQERAVHRRLVAAQTTNLLLLEEEVQCGGNLYLVFPFCSGGDLFDVHGKLLAPGRVGKAWYMAPEVFATQKPYDPLQADMWSLGVLLAIMLAGAPLVEKPTGDDRQFRVLSHGGGVRKLHRVFPRKLSDVVWDLLEKLLNVNPAKRPTLEQVAEHPFLSSEYHHTSTYNCFTR